MSQDQNLLQLTVPGGWKLKTRLTGYLMGDVIIS